MLFISYSLIIISAWFRAHKMLDTEYLHDINNNALNTLTVQGILFLSVERKGIEPLTFRLPV